MAASGSLNGAKGFDWSMKVVGRPDDGVEAADKLGLHGVLGPALRTPPAADTRGAYLYVQLDEWTRDPANQPVSGSSTCANNYSPPQW